MVKRWVVIMIFGSIGLSGCVSAGLFSQGESASYAFWNNSDNEVEAVKIVGVYLDYEKELAGASRAKAAHWNTRWFVGGYQYMADTGHKVPEEVDVSWRKLPPPGGKPYTGEPMGPYRVKVRSRIPQEALKLAGRKGYSLGVEFSVGKEPVQLCWGVVTKKGASILGTIMSGGQCNPEDVAWRKDIDWHEPGHWYPEK
jgi:hypothetical protein